MAHRLVTDMTIERFQAWRSLLSQDRGLSHRLGIVAVRPEGAMFQPGVNRTSLPVRGDPYFEAMGSYPDGHAFDYDYEASVHPVIEQEVAIAPGYYACLLVFENDLSLDMLRPRVDELILLRQQAAAAAAAELSSTNVLDPPAEPQPGAA